MSEAEWYLVIYSTAVPALIVAMGALAAYLHGRYMDRVDAEEARERATGRQPAE